MKLSPRQHEILEFIAAYQVENGYSPSLREIGDAFKLASVATVHQHVAALEKKGYVNKDWNKGRSLALSELAAKRIEKDKARADQGGAAAFAKPGGAPWAAPAPMSGDIAELPLLGTIA